MDISATSDLTISQVAEGLSTDILTASGVVPTLQDMGLGSFFTPSGLLQNALDFLHNMGKLRADELGRMKSIDHLEAMLSQ